jgi:hypothetical protein
LAKVTAERSQVQRPPIRMLDVLIRIRLPEPAVEQVARLYAVLASLARRLC